MKCIDFAAQEARITDGHATSISPVSGKPQRSVYISPEQFVQFPFAEQTEAPVVLQNVIRAENEESPVANVSVRAEN